MEHVIEVDLSGTTANFLSLPLKPLAAQEGPGGVPRQRFPGNRESEDRSAASDVGRRKRP